MGSHQSHDQARKGEPKEKGKPSGRESMTSQGGGKEVYGAGSRGHVLVAEDDDEMRRLLAWRLRREGYEVTECSDGLGLADLLVPSILGAERSCFDAVISDVLMPGMSGLEVLQGISRLEHKNRFPPIILITAFGDEETHAEADRLGAAAVLNKPFEIKELLAKVREVVSTSPLR